MRLISGGFVGGGGASSRIYGKGLTMRGILVEFISTELRNFEQIKERIIQHTIPKNFVCFVSSFYFDFRCPGNICVPF